MRLLLVSNSTEAGRGYLEHCARAVQELFGARRRIAFVPWALADLDGYARKARERFAALGYELRSVHEARDPRQVLDACEGVFIGGGNTFRLLRALYVSGLFDALRERVPSGLPYLGTSAGSNVATRSIRTTNDMPIVEPPSFEALDFVPFQINPHFLDADPASTHMGETRETRIREFHEEHAEPVLGLREGAWLFRDGDRLALCGDTGARLFRRGMEPLECTTGADLGFLLQG
jgi:dipeptidase E